MSNPDFRLKNCSLTSRPVTYFQVRCAASHLQAGLMGMLLAGILIPVSSAKIESEWWDNQTHTTKESYVLPTLGSQPGLIDQESDKATGEAILREINKDAPRIDDPLIQDEIEKIYRRIYAQTLLGAPTALVLIQDEEINAFAVPGGLVAVNTGLILSAQNADQVAGVLSHEIAHVSQRHYDRQVDALKYQKWWMLGGMMAAIALGRKDGDASAAVFAGTEASMINQQLAYSRDNEREADRVGMQLMQSAGYDPEAMPDFFEIMQRKTRMVGFIPSFVLTHPLTSERITESRLRATQYRLEGIKSTSALLDKDAGAVPANMNPFHLMQMRLAAMTQSTSIGALTPQAARDEGAQLALAYLDQQANRIADARKLVGPLLMRYPDSPFVAVTAAEIELADSKPAAAIHLLEPMLGLMPDCRPVAMTLARAYVAAGQGQAALSLMKPWSVRRPTDTQIWQLMVDAAGKLPVSSANTVSVLRYRAEQQFWLGDNKAALRSLDRAGALADKNSLALAEINERTKYMEYKAKEKIKGL